MVQLFECKIVIMHEKIFVQLSFQKLLVDFFSKCFKKQLLSDALTHGGGD